MKPEFKLIVAGSRTFNDSGLLSAEIIKLSHNELEDYAVSIVTGLALGADLLAYNFARGMGIKLYEYPANWALHGSKAGILRNIDMGNFADGVLAFWDGRSRGTKHMIDFMIEKQKRVHVIRFVPPALTTRNARLPNKDD